MDQTFTIERVITYLFAVLGVPLTGDIFSLQTGARPPGNKCHDANFMRSVLTKDNTTQTRGKPQTIRSIFSINFSLYKTVKSAEQCFLKPKMMLSKVLRVFFFYLKPQGNGKVIYCHRAAQKAQYWYSRCSQPVLNFFFLVTQND